MIDVMIQASSRSWSGGRDICINPVQGKPAICHTVERLRQALPEARITIAAPAFDSEGDLPRLLADYEGINLFFGCDDSPLKRMLAAWHQYLDQTWFLRINGLNMFFDADQMREMIAVNRSATYDCIRFPDGWPAVLTFDLYRVSALQRLDKTLEPGSPFSVHPKYALDQEPFDSKIYRPTAPVLDEDLRTARAMATELYREPRDDIHPERHIAVGDTLGFHYRMACEYITAEDRVLDIACGTGRGSAVLAEKAGHVVGVDLDPDCIDRARSLPQKNLTFVCDDACQPGLPDASFDVVTSFETIEHLDPTRFLAQLRRVIKPGGRLILSTPQNILGHIPINPQHLIEFSLEQIREQVAAFFKIDRVIGIKQGRVIKPGDPRGNNTFLIATREV